jgi:hypothetical protein
MARDSSATGGGTRIAGAGMAAPGNGDADHGLAG